MKEDFSFSAEHLALACDCAYASYLAEIKWLTLEEKVHAEVNAL